MWTQQKCTMESSPTCFMHGQSEKADEIPFDFSGNKRSFSKKLTEVGYF